MGVIVSSLVFTRRDMTGNRWTDGYFVVEFRDAGAITSGVGYQTGGESFDFSPYFANVQYVTAVPISGATTYEPRPNYADYPGGPGIAASGRIMLNYLASTIVTINMSGIGIRVASGQVLIASGGFLAYSGGTSPLSIMFSGAISAVTSGSIGVGTIQTEVLSGTALSGTRAVVHVLGY